MTLLLLLRRHTSSFFERFGWAGIGMLLLVHYGVSWLLLTLAGEEHLLQGLTSLISTSPLRPPSAMAICRPSQGGASWSPPPGSCWVALPC